METKKFTLISLFIAISVILLDSFSFSIPITYYNSGVGTVGGVRIGNESAGTPFCSTLYFDDRCGSSGPKER
ncbi:726_t:CDS:2 [Ambispora gerdemannii]|uniref:726_t:CDS:1 n=1 Tax=Ambispora gerdemannii TaxID=144530 RepID=A0A9N9FYM2_9GLOM|nr:726_t:CDS:2 [Ambispora gerdemannii]